MIPLNLSDPAHTNHKKENALHVAVDSTCGDKNIAEVMKLMLQNLAERSVSTLHPASHQLAKQTMHKIQLK